jgi:transcriptional antiterminator RfaH
MLNPPTEPNWQVLLVRPRSEKKVEQQLKRLGVEACVPTQKLVKRWSDRKKVVDTVLFNNYVFVTAPGAKRNVVLGLDNVFNFLKFGKEIASLTEQDVLLVKQLAGLAAPVQITYQSLQKGDRVEFVSGCLVGRQGHIVSVNGGEKIQVEVPNLGCFGLVGVTGVEVRRV